MVAEMGTEYILQLTVSANQKIRVIRKRLNLIIIKKYTVERINKRRTYILEISRISDNF